MTDCKHPPIGFSTLSGRSVQADFAGGRITSDAGALLLREVDRRIGLIDALNRAVPDPRNPELIVHEQKTLLAQRILSIALGYEDLNDQQTLREDALLQLITERGIDPEQPLASPPTLCRLENRVYRPTLVAMVKVLVEAFIASHEHPPEELVLDFDATDDPVHGRQEGRFFHGYYDQYCFLPLYVFCGEQLLVPYLRPANIDAAKHAWAILSLLVKRFRQVWPKVRIVFRGDSGFCRRRMLRWCEQNDVGYLVGLAKNARLLRLAEPWMKQAERLPAIDGEARRVFTEISYAAGSWDRERRVLIKAEHLVDKANPRFVVTNLTGRPQTLYEDRYCARGEAENRIKEQQLMLFADRTSCHKFRANQFRLLLSSAAYVLVQTLRRVGLAGTELAEAQVSTIRTRLLKIGARVATSVRRVVLHLAAGYPLQELFVTVVERLRSPAWSAVRLE